MEITKTVAKDLLLTSAVALTLADRRLYNYLLLNAFDNLPKQLDFVISLNELEGVYETGAAPIDRLQESLRRLIKTLVEYKTETTKWVITSLLNSAELNELKGELYYSYPAPCRGLFTNPFTLEKCLVQAHFTQKYSNLIYECLASAYYDKQSTFCIEISDLRSRLQISERKLSNFSDLDRFVLIPALKEINSYASFAVKFHTRRKGMKVTHIIFEMISKRNIPDFDNAKSVVPTKRPRLFIENPALEQAYAYLLNINTDERRKFFEIACKHAAKKKQTIDEEAFDRPDVWFRWVEHELLKKE